MRRLVAALAALGLLSACAATGDTFAMNDQAKAIGHIQVAFVRTGVGSGPVTITMPDGEVLHGHYRVAFGGGEAFAFSGAHSATALIITDGPVQFVASGPKTEMLCRGTSSTMGHGNGQCQTYVLALAIVAASTRKQNDFLLRLAASGGALLLTLVANVLAIIEPCSQSEMRAHAL